MLLSLLLVRTGILPCFFLFLAVLSNFLFFLVFKENARVKIALDFPTIVPITVFKKKIHTPPLVVERTNRILCHQFHQIFYVIKYSCIFT